MRTKILLGLLLLSFTFCFVSCDEDTKEEDANALGEKIGEAFPDVEIEVHYGGQPIYYYVISVE